MNATRYQYIEIQDIELAQIEIYAKPSKLYRYRGLGANAAREIEAIRKGYIYCPAHVAMNDPMEGSHRVSLRFSKNPKSEKRRLAVEGALNSMGIAALSEICDHEPMWAHYASNFSGICIEYSMSRLLKGLAEDVVISRMMYSEREPVMLDDKRSAMDRARLCLSCKSVRWSSEREWRLFSPRRGPANYGAKNVVTKILLGGRVSPDDEHAIRAAAADLSIPVSKMEISAYTLSFSSVKSSGRAGKG